MPNTILITGANGQLGTVVVKKFLEEKYKIIAVGRSASAPENTKGNPLYNYHKVNLASEPETAAFAQEAIKQYGRIDGALLLAGGFAMGSIGDTDGKALKEMFSLNFDTAYNIARPVFQHMVQNGYGRLVFVGSRPALEPKEGKSKMAYALSKSLLLRLAEMLNAEAKGKNVVTSVIAPSIIDTAENRKDMPDANYENWVKAEQIAEILEFICSQTSMPIREPIYKLYNNA